MSAYKLICLACDSSKDAFLCMYRATESNHHAVCFQCDNKEKGERGGQRNTYSADTHALPQYFQVQLGDSTARKFPKAVYQKIGRKNTGSPVRSACIANLTETCR